ncbi:colicin E3/pyocin S6 family cytotoxin, partial [Aneurinibacillus aneurinilyticus]|uniref:colicin E3/pyocin S6 family cytotoxin n=1 Tax=Aneurinibacillus aneurinilyticus TaxID=1391 RepID=UPI003525D8F2
WGINKAQPAINGLKNMKRKVDEKAKPFLPYVDMVLNVTGGGRGRGRVPFKGKSNYNDFNKIQKGDNATYKILKEETNWMKDNGLEFKGTINNRKTWFDGKYWWQWDSKKGALEKWDKKKKKHLGEFNAVTGEQSGPAVPGRKWGK